MLYKQLTIDLLDKISNGTIPVGERLPPEAEYAQQLGVSRSTLRLAFSQLEQQGIIKRKKRGGTEIIADTPIKKFNMVSGGLFDILSIGPETSAIISDVRFVKAQELEELAGYCETATRWLSFTSNRFMVDEPRSFIFSHVYVPYQYSDLGLSEGDRIEAIYKLIEKRYEVKVMSVKQSVSAELCSEDAAACMGLTERDPVLTSLIELEDIGGNLLQVAYACFNPSRIHLNSKIQIVV